MDSFLNANKLSKISLQMPKIRTWASQKNKMTEVSFAGNPIISNYGDGSGGLTVGADGVMMLRFLAFSFGYLLTRSWCYAVEVLLYALRHSWC